MLPFAFGGAEFLRLLGISLAAFRIFGGLLPLSKLHSRWSNARESRYTVPQVPSARTSAAGGRYPVISARVSNYDFRTGGTRNPDPALVSDPVEVSAKPNRSMFVGPASLLPTLVLTINTRR